jgi:hypothetical protein
MSKLFGPKILKTKTEKSYEIWNFLAISSKFEAKRRRRLAVLKILKNLRIKVISDKYLHLCIVEDQILVHRHNKFLQHIKATKY